MAKPRLHIGFIETRQDGEEGISTLEIELPKPPRKRVTTDAQQDSNDEWLSDYVAGLKEKVRLALTLEGYTIKSK